MKISALKALKEFHGERKRVGEERKRKDRLKESKEI